MTTSLTKLIEDIRLLRAALVRPDDTAPDGYEDCPINRALKHITTRLEQIAKG